MLRFNQLPALQMICQLPPMLAGCDSCITGAGMRPNSSYAITAMLAALPARASQQASAPTTADTFEVSFTIADSCAISVCSSYEFHPAT